MSFSKGLKAELQLSSLCSSQTDTHSSTVHFNCSKIQQGLITPDPSCIDFHAKIK